MNNVEGIWRYNNLLISIIPMRETLIEIKSIIVAFFVNSIKYNVGLT